jgi:alkylhydroperoxidase family enzyme
MSQFPVHSIETAPEASRPAMQTLLSAFGFLPNIAGAMSTSPVLIGALPPLFGSVHGGSFSEAQVQVLLLTNAVTNGAAWPVAFHSFLALKEGIDPADVAAIRSGCAPRDKQAAALSTLAKTLIETRGQITEQDKAAFLEAGFEPQHLLEVVAAVAASTITNYTAGVTAPPLEPQFQPHAWQAGQAEAA